MAERTSDNKITNHPVIVSTSKVVIDLGDDYKNAGLGPYADGPIETNDKGNSEDQPTSHMDCIHLFTRNRSPWFVKGILCANGALVGEVEYKQVGPVEEQCLENGVGKRGVRKTKWYGVASIDDQGVSQRS